LWLEARELFITISLGFEILKLGCCGWGYFKVNDFLEEYRGIDTDSTDWKELYRYKVQAHADFFNLVEVNKTFYKLPQVKTAQKWKNLAITKTCRGSF